jgi:hypothetical protein
MLAAGLNSWDGFRARDCQADVAKPRGVHGHRLARKGRSPNGPRHLMGRGTHPIRAE